MLGKGVIALTAQHSPGSTICHLPLDYVLFLLTGLCSQLKAAPVAWGLCSWNSFGECSSAASKNCAKTCMIFRGSGSHERTWPSCTNSRRLGGHVRAHPILAQPLQPPKNCTRMVHVFESTCQVMVNADVSSKMLWHVIFDTHVIGSPSLL